MKKFPSKAKKTSGLRATTVLFVSILAFTSQIAGSARALDSELDTAAYKLLADRCADCHDGQSHELDIVDIDALVAERGDGKDRFVSAGHADSSYLMKLVESDVMPKNSDPLTVEEKDLLKRWIDAGATFPEYGVSERSFISEGEILESIKQHLFDTSADDRPFIRYFSLHVLSNRRQLPDEKLRLAAGALAKAINSLSREAPKVEMTPVGSGNTLFAVNLKDLAWETNTFEKWNLILKSYPYGVKPVNNDLRETFDDIERQYKADGFFDGIAYIRGDWFIDQALRPKLYHELLEIPQTLSELQKEEGFNLETDFRRGQIIRGGVLNSKVSSQSRVIDFHQAKDGVWMSYDFLRSPEKDPERGNIIRFPLGPKFDANEFGEAAFEHAGGEIIFTLPNGLHGYMLVDGKGDRLDEGPINIVSDFDKTSGSPLIVNGLSCIGCHRQGMIMFKDGIASGHGRIASKEVKKIKALYRPDELQRSLVSESREYLRNLQQVIGEFVQVEENRDKPIEEFPEPISATSKLFQRDLQLEDIAAELGMKSVEFLRQSIEQQTELRSLGLGVLPNGGSIKRDQWEAIGVNGDSVFQKVSRAFGFIPVQKPLPANQ